MIIDIGKLADQLITSMSQASGQAIGDGIRPDNVGWLDGQPNTGIFIPYGVMSFQGAQPRDTTLRFAEQVRAWMTTWRLSYYGASRQQCDWVATQIRNELDNAIGQEFGLYKVTGVSWRGLGPMERMDEIDPPLWATTDTFTLSCDA